MRNALLLFAACGPIGCSNSGRSIEYIVPKDHRGPVWVLEDPEVPEVPVVNGKYQVVFPQGGVLHVKTMKPFEKWYSTSARFDDGTALHADLVSGQATVVPETIAMWSICRSSTWPDKRDYIAWVVGTEADARRFADTMRTAPPNP